LFFPAGGDYSRIGSLKKSIYQLVRIRLFLQNDIRITSTKTGSFYTEIETFYTEIRTFYIEIGTFCTKNGTTNFANCCK